MSTLELLNNIHTFYVSPANAISSLEIITYDDLHEMILTAFNVGQIAIQTSCFILKELFLEAFTHLTFDKVLYVIVIFNVLLLIGLDNMKRKLTEQNKIVVSLEEEVLYLKKTERLREYLYEFQIKDTRDKSNKIDELDKKIKKLNNALKIYE